MNKIYFAKVKEEAIIPSKRPEDAGFDFYACIKEDYVKINPFETKLIPTGIACSFNKNFYMQIEERSSTGIKGLKKSAGVIDSGYRGEIMIALYNANANSIYISNIPYEEIEKIEKKPFIYFTTKKAIAQGILHKIPKFKSCELSYKVLKKIPSVRGAKGFGSTDKNKI